MQKAVRTCFACQNSDKRAPIQPIQYPMRPWAKFAIDIMGLFARAPFHKRNILVMTCFYSKWPEVLLCGEITVAVISKWFRHLFARFGLPEDIVSDNGPQFRSN